MNWAHFSHPSNMKDPLCTVWDCIDIAVNIKPKVEITMKHTTVFLIHSIRGAEWLNALLYLFNFSMCISKVRSDLKSYGRRNAIFNVWFWHQQAEVTCFNTEHGENIYQKMHMDLFLWSALPQILLTAESSDTMSSSSACHVIFIKSPQWITGQASRFNSRRNSLSGIISKFESKEYMGVHRGDSAIRQQNRCQELYFWSLHVLCDTEWSVHISLPNRVVSQQGARAAQSFFN